MPNQRDMCNHRVKTPKHGNNNLFVKLGRELLSLQCVSVVTLHWLSDITHAFWDTWYHLCSSVWVSDFSFYLCINNYVAIWDISSSWTKITGGSRRSKKAVNILARTKAAAFLLPTWWRKGCTVMQHPSELHMHPCPPKLCKGQWGRQNPPCPVIPSKIKQFTLFSREIYLK